MNRRSFIQRFVYSLLVLFFGPGILEQLDLEQTEKVVDELERRTRPPSRRFGGVKLTNVLERIHQPFRDSLVSRDGLLEKAFAEPLFG